MSEFKPAKQPHMENQSQVMRTESVCLQDSIQSAEVRDLPTSTLPMTETTQKEKPSHPKGHKVREMKDIWAMMDKHPFLHLTDSLTLGDIWVQPRSVDETSVSYGNASVEFLEMIYAPHLKYRMAYTKISIDDLLHMLYLGDKLMWIAENHEICDFDAWLSYKTAEFIKVYGVGESSNRAKLCNFVMKEDKEYSFYPRYLQNNVGLFFRKICYHSYKGEGEEKKYVNPAMIKCCGGRSKFEYMLEGRYIPLPQDWNVDPATQNI